MLFYAVFSGAPIIIVGYLGVEIQKRIPRVFSFSDYVMRVRQHPLYASVKCTLVAGRVPTSLDLMGVIAR